jgi:hypothetical protein
MPDMKLRRLFEAASWRSNGVRISGHSLGIYCGSRHRWVKHWLLATLKGKLIKIGANIVSQAAISRYLLAVGKISTRDNRYLRVLFVQAAWVVLVKPKSWERYGLKPWVEAVKRRLHHNVLAIALAKKLARIAWAVLNKERNFECVKTSEMASRDPLERGTVLGVVKARPGNPAPQAGQARRPALTAPVRGAPGQAQAGTKGRPHGPNSRRSQWRSSRARRSTIGQTQRQER